jgi:3-methylcrotonyl-CoA carboxylase beta subunit
MKIVGSDVDPRSADYQENYQKMMALNDRLDEITR